MTAAGPLLLLLAQTGAGATEASLPPDQARSFEDDGSMNRFDLADMPDRPSSVERDVIVVRADRGRYRAEPVFDPRFEEDGKAEFGIGDGARAAAEVEQEEIAPGIVSNRMMLRLKMPF